METSTMFYILEGKSVVPVSSGLDWAVFFEANDEKRVVARNETVIDGHKYLVSTVFIGLNDSIFETMAFRDGDDIYQERASTWQDAEQVHLNICRKLVDKRGKIDEKEN